MSARFAGMGLVAAIGWYAWQWQAATLSFGGGVWRVLACAFLSAALGKIVGVMRFRASRPSH